MTTLLTFLLLMQVVTPTPGGFLVLSKWTPVPIVYDPCWYFCIDPTCFRICKDKPIDIIEGNGHGLVADSKCKDDADVQNILRVLNKLAQGCQPKEAK